MNKIDDKGAFLEKETSEAIANDTWRKGFIHLTVDGFGLVSLWDHGFSEEEVSYIKLPLTKEQQDLIQATMNKQGATP